VPQHTVAVTPTLDGIAASLVVALATIVGVTQSQELVLLFVVLPVLVAPVVIGFVAWRSSGKPPPVRTSTILADGQPAEAEILAIKSMGGIVDMRPMVRFSLRVTSGPDEAPFDLEVTQSVPRGLVREFRVGASVEVRVTADRSAGAIVWGGPGAGPGANSAPDGRR